MKGMPIFSPGMPIYIGNNNLHGAPVTFKHVIFKHFTFKPVTFKPVTFKHVTFKHFTFKHVTFKHVTFKPVTFKNREKVTIFLTYLKHYTT